MDGFSIVSVKHIPHMHSIISHQLTEGEGISLAKDGACHKLLISSCQEEHSGRYRFEAEGRKSEATLNIQGMMTGVM